MFSFLTTVYQDYPLAVYYFAGINIVTLFLYGYDKILATSNSWRIRERTLLIFALFGGTIGAMLGIKLFRHKTRKDAFLVQLAIILVLQVAFFIYYFQHIVAE
jgi:uncharacterized membrane protein YsdA (DUF1294 family)